MKITAVKKVYANFYKKAEKVLKEIKIKSKFRNIEEKLIAVIVLQKYKKGSFEVDFYIYLPFGTYLKLESINGDVEVENLKNTLYVKTVNGEVEFILKEIYCVKIITVNGDIKGEIKNTKSLKNVFLKSVNGDVTLYLKDKVKKISAHTLHGRMRTDFPLSPHKNVKIQLNTTNGDINIFQIKIKKEGI